MLLISLIGFLKEIDKSIFLLINGCHNSVLDVVMHYISHKFFWIPLYLLILIVLAKKLQQRVLLVLVFVAITITLTDQICLHFFKNVFQRFRPCHNLELAPIVHLVDGCGGMYGFISSHAANSFALAVFLIPLFKELGKKSLFFFIWAALIAYSRVYLGQHYPSDVVVGGLLGIVIGWLTSKAYFYVQAKNLNA